MKTFEDDIHYVPGMHVKQPDVLGGENIARCHVLLSPVLSC